MKSPSIKKARNLRKNQTEPERLLWSKLRNRQLENHKFKRQYPVGKYVVDFICIESHLIIEIDGGGHAQKQERDYERTQWLESKGYRVIRFWNNEVTKNLKAVLEKILFELDKE